MHITHNQCGSVGTRKVQLLASRLRTLTFRRLQLICTKRQVFNIENFLNIYIFVGFKKRRRLGSIYIYVNPHMLYNEHLSTMTT